MDRGLYSRSFASIAIAAALVTFEANSCFESDTAQVQLAASGTGSVAQPAAAIDAGTASSPTETQAFWPLAVAVAGGAFRLVGGLTRGIGETSIAADERIGWLAGGGSSNRSASPPGSVSFTYDVSDISASDPAALQSVRKGPADLTLLPMGSPRASAGARAADSDTQVRIASGAPLVIDGKSRAGLAFTGGIGPATNLSNLSAAMDGEVPHGGVFANSGYIPGKMPTTLLGVNLGVEWRY